MKTFSVDTNVDTIKLFMKMAISLEGPISLSSDQATFEPTCANARWAPKSRIPSVCLSVRDWTIITRQ